MTEYENLMTHIEIVKANTELLKGMYNVNQISRNRYLEFIKRSINVLKNSYYLVNQGDGYVCELHDLEKILKEEYCNFEEW